MTTHERARDLLARRRQQHENRRAAMLGRSNQEVYRLRRLSSDCQ
jgi:3-methyladenine DNA glycosylase AlkC